MTLLRGEEDAVIPQIKIGYYGITQHGTGLLTAVNGDATMLGEVYSEDEVTGYGQAYIDPDRLAFSPNGDGVNDVVIPGWACCAMPLRYAWRF